MTQRMVQESISPSLALAYLEKGGNWRLLNEQRAARLAEAIRRNGWRQDGSTIKFDSRGMLVDGQHRLKAIILADVTVTAWVVYGVDEGDTIDTGSSRTITQRAKAEGEKYYAVYAALLVLIYRYRRAKLYSTDSAFVPTVADLVVLAGEVPEARISSSVVGKCKYRVGSMSQLSLVHFLAATGGYHAKLPPLHKLSMLIATWNAWSGGRPMKQLRVPQNADGYAQFHLPVSLPVRE